MFARELLTRRLFEKLHETCKGHAKVIGDNRYLEAELLCFRCCLGAAAEFSRSEGAPIRKLVSMRGGQCCLGRIILAFMHDAIPAGLTEAVFVKEQAFTNFVGLCHCPQDGLSIAYVTERHGPNLWLSGAARRACLAVQSRLDAQTRLQLTRWQDRRRFQGANGPLGRNPARVAHIHQRRPTAGRRTADHLGRLPAESSAPSIGWCPESAGAGLSTENCVKSLGQCFILGTQGLSKLRSSPSFSPS